MDWNYISDNKYPNDFQEVIIAASTGSVKSAIYMGKGKFNTFLDVVCWQPFPESPVKLDEDVQVDTPKKRRGRPKNGYK